MMIEIQKRRCYIADMLIMHIITCKTKFRPNFFYLKNKTTNPYPISSSTPILHVHKIPQFSWEKKKKINNFGWENGLCLERDEKKWLMGEKIKEGCLGKLRYFRPK